MNQWHGVCVVQTAPDDTTGKDDTKSNPNCSGSAVVEQGDSNLLWCHPTSGITVNSWSRTVLFLKGSSGRDKYAS